MEHNERRAPIREGSVREDFQGGCSSVGELESASEEGERGSQRAVSSWGRCRGPRTGIRSITEMSCSVAGAKWKECGRR